MADGWGGSWGDSWGAAWKIIDERTISATDVELPLPVDVQLWKQPPGHRIAAFREDFGGKGGRKSVVSSGSGRFSGNIMRRIFSE